MPSLQTPPWHEACKARCSAKSLNGSDRELSLETPRSATAAKRKQPAACRFRRSATLRCRSADLQLFCAEQQSAICRSRGSP